MKRLLVLLLLLFPTGAMANDVTIKLNDQEQQVLLGLLDLAVKQGGLRAATNAAYFVNKIQPPAPPGAPKPEAPKP